MFRYLYSQWDGTQTSPTLDVDSIMCKLSDHIMDHGDVNRAITSLYNEGFIDGARNQVSGLQKMRQQLQEQYESQLGRYNLDSLMYDIKNRLHEIIQDEIAVARILIADAQPEEQPTTEDTNLLKSPINQGEKRGYTATETMENLPSGIHSQIEVLNHYEFIDLEAGRKFHNLKNSLTQYMVQIFFEDTKTEGPNLSSGKMLAIQDMVSALIQLLIEQTSNEIPDLQGFVETYGQVFYREQPTSMGQLIASLQQKMANMQSLMDSLSPELGDELEHITQASMNSGMNKTLSALTSVMYDFFPFDDMVNHYKFTGHDSITLKEAMNLIGQLSAMTQLDKQIQTAMTNGNIHGINLKSIEDSLGTESLIHLGRMSDITVQLEDAGYIRQNSNRLELSGRGLRNLAQQALRSLVSELKYQSIGTRHAYVPGDSGEHTGTTKPYEYGDPFDLNIHRTIFNATLRNGRNIPIEIGPEDIAINRSEHFSQTATVLLLDQSRSMGMFGSWAAAKKVALALYWLIQSQYPRDSFNIVGFSDYGMEVDKNDLPEVTWNAWVSGTNMQHGLFLARQRLSKQKVPVKQIFMITDGEPTAHMEGGQVYFAHPPSSRTLEQTLKEVTRCTQEGITINTFMLESNFHLADFINKMVRINKGRTFYTNPAELGRYVVMDYLKNSKNLT